MASSETLDLIERAETLPEGYVAVPINAEQAGSSIRICAVARQQPDPVGGHLVLLRDTTDAKVYLAALLDSAGRVLQWLEYWVQSLDGIANTFPAWREAQSNPALDARWRRMVESFETTDPRALIHIGGESEHPLPTWLDLGKKQPVHPVHEGSEENWRLCEQDALLTAATLPPFSGSLHRYLFAPGEGKGKQGGAPEFAPITPDAPTSNRTRAIGDIVGKDLVPLNPGGGLTMVRAYSSFTLESLIAVLSGGPAGAVLHGRSPLLAKKEDESQAAAAAATDEADIAAAANGEGWLFLGRHGNWGRLLESFHLKLRMLADMVGAVRALVKQTQRPLLGLAPDSFEVRWSEQGRALPLLWTARTVLTNQGDAVELPIQGSDARLFIPGAPLNTSIYRPAPVGQVPHGRCSLRLRKVNPADGVLEGTLTTQERMEASPNDLIRLRFTVSNERIDIHARLESQAALAVGEWRFRTVAHAFPQPVLAKLQAAEGVPLGNATFDLMPHLSTPCDLYSLAVLAIRALLVNPQTTLPVAFDDISSLANQVARNHDETVPLRARIRELFDRDKRWQQSLGPHRLRWEAIPPEQAMDLVPADVWADTLGLIIRMLPGVGPDSVCADYGDAEPGALHRVFDRTMQDLMNLLVRTRSLIFVDWRYNREVNAVIRDHLKDGEVSVGAAAAAAAAPRAGNVSVPPPVPPRPKPADARR